MIRPGTVLLALALGAPAMAQEAEREEILAFDVAIEVGDGGAMTVTESIRVRALGQDIRRGIYRDFPTSFPRSSGLGRIEAPFAIRSVTRDGQRENYVVEAIGGELGRGGMRVRIGRGDVFLEPDIYTYELVYQTSRWLHFGQDEDRLRWNVTGNGWAFPILSASARVHLPDATTAPDLEHWTGREGSRSSTATASWDPAERTAVFATDQRLAPNEGLTVGLTLPAGQLTPPTEAERDAWFRLDWGGYIDAGYVVLFVLGVYLLMWRRVGVDPQAAPSSLRREPPEGYSPAALGFIEQRGYHPSQLAAALVSLALSGAVRIEEDDGAWTLHRTDEGTTDPSPEERELYDGLLGRRRQIALKQTYHDTIGSAIRAFKKSLERRFEREYFRNNRIWFAAGLAISLLGLATLAWRWRFDINPVSLFLTVWLSFWTLGVTTLFWRLVQQFRSARAGGGPAAWASTGFMALFSIPFVVAEVFVAGILTMMMPTHLLLAAIGVGVTNVVFYHLLERPTLRGRGLLNRLDGFQRYLDGADDRALHGGDRLARFEQFLPFAIALGLEKRWSEAFEDVLTPALATAGGSTAVLPWYVRDHTRSSLSTGRLTSGLSSGLSSSISAASAPPASSGGGGGGGGGGFSGGGGGGGGGGGW